MSIQIPFSPKPKPLPFIKRAEAFLEKKRLEWVQHWLGTPAEPQALEYCRREGWLLGDVEGLEQVTALNLFANCTITDLKELERRIKAGELTEAAATKVVADNAKSDMGQAECGINRLRFGEGSIMARPPVDVAALAAAKRTVVAAPEPPATPPVLFRSDFVPKPVKPVSGAMGEQSCSPMAAVPPLAYPGPCPATPGRVQGVALAPPDPTQPAPTPPAACQSVLKGKPEGMGSSMHRLHEVELGGVRCYTWERQLCDDLQSAQVSGLTLEAQVQSGDFGLKLVSIKVTNP